MTNGNTMKLKGNFCSFFANYVRKVSHCKREKTAVSNPQSWSYHCAVDKQIKQKIWFFFFSFFATTWTIATVRSLFWASQRNMLRFGLMGIVLICQRSPHPSPSLCVYLYQYWPASHSSTQKANRETTGGGGKLLSTDKGSPKIPCCEKQSERTNTIETQCSAWEFSSVALSLVHLS